MGINSEHGLVVETKSIKSEVIKISQTESICCSNCNKKLLIVYVKDFGEELYKLAVDCPFCGDKSFYYEVKGWFRYVPADGVTLINMDMDDKNNKVIFKTKAI